MKPSTITAEPATAKHSTACWITYHPSGLNPGFPVFLTSGQRAELAAWLADTSRTDTIEAGA